MKMNRAYLVINLAKSSVRPDGTFALSSSQTLSGMFYPALETAALAADSYARQGTIGLVLVADSFHVVEPAPVVVERFDVTSPKD